MIPIVGVFRLDDVPRRLNRIGGADGAFGRGPELRVVATAAGDFGNEFQVLTLIFRAATLLRPLAQVEPEFRDDRPIGRDGVFELDDPLQRPLVTRLADVGGSELNHRVGVPGTEHDRDATARGQATPEAPERRPVVVGVGLVPERVGLHEMGIEPLVQPGDHLAFAGAFDAGDEDDDGTLLCPREFLRRQQCGVQRGLPCIVGRP